MSVLKIRYNYGVAKLNGYKYAVINEYLIAFTH